MNKQNPYYSISFFESIEYYGFLNENHILIKPAGEIPCMVTFDENSNKYVLRPIKDLTLISGQLGDWNSFKEKSLKNKELALKVLKIPFHELEIIRKNKYLLGELYTENVEGIQVR